MKELEIQKTLRLNGLEKTVNELNLICKKYNDGRVLFKYRQIDAIWSRKETHECRGIILNENDNWNVVSLSYFKFFNYGEPLCAKIDTPSVKWYEKSDGSLITFYWWNNEWNIQTSGSINAFDISYTENSFGDLCIIATTKMYGSYENFLSKLDKKYFYMFELMTPENIVVAQHKTYTLKLHGIRNKETLEEISIDNFNDLIKVDKYNFNNVEDVIKVSKTLSWENEGFIGVDKYFNRCKIKGPEYVAMHYTATSISMYSIVDILKQNELEEYLLYFDNKKEFYKQLEKNFLELVKEFQDVIDFCHTISNLDKKEFALIILEKYTGLKRTLAFKYNQISARDYINTINNKIIYKLINK